VSAPLSTSKRLGCSYLVTVMLPVGEPIRKSPVPSGAPDNCTVMLLSVVLSASVIVAVPEAVSTASVKLAGRRRRF
jgi:hypothetical protein